MVYKLTIGLGGLLLVYLVYRAEHMQFVEWHLKPKPSGKIQLHPIKKTEEANSITKDQVIEVMSESLNLAPDSIAASQSFAALGFGGADSGVGNSSGAGFMADLVRQAKTSRGARLVEKANPVFPHEARSQNISGSVNVKILIGISGGVEKIEIVNAEPPGFFEKSAIESIKKWRFEPALNEGQAQASWISQKIKFELE
jgi:TonB family protein